MGGVKKCVVCKRSEKLPGVRLFSFPRQKYRCDQWLQNIGNPELYKFSTYRLSVAYKVCEQHFERNCFFSDMLNRLVRDAVPTLFGPNIKQHVAIDNSVLKYQQNKYFTDKLLKLDDRCHEIKDYNKSTDRLPENMISVSVIEDLADSIVLHEDGTCADSSFNNLDVINCDSDKISQHDFSHLNAMSVCTNKLEHTCDKQIITQESASVQAVVDKMCGPESKEYVASANTHLAYACRIENNSSPISDSDGVSVEGFVQEGFLHSWMVGDSVLNEDDNSSTLFGKICEQVSDKKDFVQDISEAGMSFNDESETVAAEERNLEEGQFSDYQMDVSSMHGLDQSDFLHNWMPGNSIVNNKVNVSNDRLDEQHCALSDIAIGLMDEGRGHEKKNSVKDITVCNWESEKVSADLPKLPHEDYDDLDVSERNGSEQPHFENIFLHGLCEGQPRTCPETGVRSSDELSACSSMPMQVINDNLFHSQKFVNKKLADLSNASKEIFKKAFELTKDANDSEDREVVSTTVSLLPVEFSFGKGFPTLQVLQPNSDEVSDKLCQVTYVSHGIPVTETNLNPRLQSWVISSPGSELNENILCNDQLRANDNATNFENAKDICVDVTESEEASDATNYMLYNFESICRLCLAADQVMYPIFSDSDSVPQKDIASCIPVKVQKDDIYPKLMCRKCYDQMASWLKFKEVCFNSQSILEQFTISTCFDSTDNEKQERNFCISLPVEPVQEGTNVFSRSTQTVPMVELIIGEGPLISEPGIVQQNKENDLLCQKIKRRRLTLRKKRMPCDVKVRRAREIISGKRSINRGKSCRGIEPSSCSSTGSNSQGIIQNKVANVMKQLHFSGLKPGCRLTVADKRYLIVGTRSGSKSGVGLFTKQHFCSETDCKRECKNELST